jgi:hypothetical protein
MHTRNINRESMLPKLVSKASLRGNRTIRNPILSIVTGWFTKVAGLASAMFTTSAIARVP